MSEFEVQLALSLTDEEARELFCDEGIWYKGEGPTYIRTMEYIYACYVCDRGERIWADGNSLEYAKKQEKEELQKLGLRSYQRVTDHITFEFEGDEWSVSFSDDKSWKEGVEIKGEAAFFMWLVKRGYFAYLDDGIEKIVKKLVALREAA